MKEVSIKELNNYINVLEMESKPAIALASDLKRTNGLTIGWFSIGTLWRKPCATVYIHLKRFSKQIFDNAEYFSICFLREEDKKQIAYFGSVSGKDEDKMSGCGLEVDEDLAPYFKDSKVVIICKKMGQSDFDANSVDEGVKAWYLKDGVHTQYYGEIIKVLIND